MIYGQRIRLRAIEKEDIPRFVVWLNDPEVRRGISIYLPFSTVDEEHWFERMQELPQYEHPLVIEVRQAGKAETWVPIGDIGFHKVDWRNRSAEFGIVIGDKAYWNQGYGTEAVKLIVCYGFQSLNLNRIFLRVFANNPRAIRAYEKAGFTREGCLRQAEFQEGMYIDVFFMSILRSEWQG